MKTIYWRVPAIPDAGDQAIQEAAALLKQGKRVAFPTETVYGLGADARNSQAVEGIFQAKGRPSDNPLIVHIADRSQLDDLVNRPDEASLRLMETFWPGPLTIVMPIADGAVSPSVTAGLTTVGVRMPDHPIALSLIRAADCPVAAPSANRSGRPSPTLASHVQEDLDGLIEGVLDGGETGVGLESTVVEVHDGAVHILRPGGVTREQLQAAGFAVADYSPEDGEHAAKAAAPRSPGMKYTHYAPKGRLLIVEGDEHSRVVERIQQEIDQARRDGQRTGILTFEEYRYMYHADVILTAGSVRQPDELAHGLYAVLRRFDEAGVQFIAAEACREDGIGHAVMNRLRKAAGGQMIHV